MQLTIRSDDLAALASDKEGPTLIDVRDPEEFAQGAIEGAANIPLDALSSALVRYDPGEHLVFVCLTGQRSLKAVSFARSVGYSNARSLQGGMREWQIRG